MLGSVQRRWLACCVWVEGARGASGGATLDEILSKGESSAAKAGELGAEVEWRRSQRNWRLV